MQTSAHGRRARATRTYGLLVDPVAPGGAGIIYQHVQGCFARGELAHEALDLGDFLKVGGYRDACAGTLPVQLFRGLLTILGGARGDVDLSESMVSMDG